VSGDERLKAAWRALADGAGPAEPCPPAERVFDAATGASSSEETAAIVDHVGRCPTCAEAWRLATELAEEEQGAAIVPFPAPPPRPELPAEPANDTWRRYLPAVALGLAAAAGLLVVVSGVDSQDDWPVYREDAGPTLATPAPELHAPRADLVLTWSGAPEGSSYDLVVTDASLGELAAAKGLREARFVLPAERFAGVPSGGAMLWRVEALAPDGKRIASPTWRITVD
jgi:hypothetical protein